MSVSARATARHSLRWELVATLVVVLMLAIVSLSFASELLGRRRDRDDHRRQLQTHAQNIAALVEPQLNGSVLAATARGQLEPILRASIGTLGVEAMAIHLVPDNGEAPRVVVGLMPTLPPPDSDRRVFETAAFTIVDRPLRSRRRIAGERVLRVVSRTPSWTQAHDWPEVLALALGVGIVVLVLAIALLERQVLRPLRAVRQAVQAVTRGDLLSTVPETGPDELRALAGSFNAMTTGLRERIAHIEAQRTQLVRAEQLAAVGQLAAGVAHELGNPLSAVLGYVELLLDPRTRDSLDPSSMDMLARSRSQLERMQALVAQLLDYSRPPTQQPRTLNARESAAALCELLQHDPRVVGVELRVLGRANAPLFVDPALLDQVLRNLIVNGARATASQPTRIVCICVGHGPDCPTRTTLDVLDSGPGVLPETIPRLFEPFFTTAKPGEGTGLGLPICRSLAESMGGSLELLHAHNPDDTTCAGAGFRVKLPACPSDLRSPASSPSPP